MSRCASSRRRRISCVRRSTSIWRSPARRRRDSLRFAFGLDQFHAATFAAVSMPLDRTVEEVGLQNAVIERSRRNVTSPPGAIVSRRKPARRFAVRSGQSGPSRWPAPASTWRSGKSTWRGYAFSAAVQQSRSGQRAGDAGEQSQEVAARAEVALARLGVRVATGVLDPRGTSTEWAAHSGAW